MIVLMIILFVAGYFLIATEHLVKVNKAATALVTGILCWTVYILATDDKPHVVEELTGHLGELSGILFFLLGAMTIVELIDAYQGFDIITTRIRQTNKRKLLWIISFITFFLSPVLDNLTATIVMISLTRKLVKDPGDRLHFAGMIVIAANAGGAWSPIGDVTTTMLWIGNQLSASAIIITVFLPSLLCMLLPLAWVTTRLHGRIESAEIVSQTNTFISKTHQHIVFFTGVLILILVPVFKTVTHLPPYMGILLGLGILWIITEIIHGGLDTSDKEVLSVAHALRKIDTPSILFFLGILVSIAALQVTGVLDSLALWLNGTLRSDNIIVISLGVLSAIIDNVPLVAAAQGMYELTQYPTDHTFWHFLAYSTGTGGSALIIGSAAGVAAMGMEKITFYWYLKFMTLPALAGFLAGAGLYLLQKWLL